MLIVLLMFGLIFTIDFTKAMLHGSSKSRRTLVSPEQGSMDVNAYYTKLKILWDELKNYQLILVCHCGGTKSWLEHQ